MAHCKATLKYNIASSGDSPDWRHADCGRILNESGDNHDDGDRQHKDYNQGRTWYGNMDGETQEG